MGTFAVSAAIILRDLASNAFFSKAGCHSGFCGVEFTTLASLPVVIQDFLAFFVARKNIRLNFRGLAQFYGL